jgi:hypothetical protein
MKTVQTENKSATDLVRLAGMSRSRLRAVLARPCWQEAGRMHDWRNHIPEQLRRAWQRMPESARVAAYIVSAHEAEREDWDALLS